MFTLFHCLLYIYTTSSHVQQSLLSQEHLEHLAQASTTLRTALLHFQDHHYPVVHRSEFS